MWRATGQRLMHCPCWLEHEAAQSSHKEFIFSQRSCDHGLSLRVSISFHNSFVVGDARLAVTYAARVSMQPVPGYWDERLHLHTKRLSEAHKSYVLDPNYKLSYSRVMQTVDDVANRARNKKVSRCLFKLKPALDHLGSFSSAVITMAQTQATPICLIWGGIEVLLKTAMHYLSVIETITDMLEQLTTCMTRLNRYITLLPNRAVLGKCLDSVCDEYIEFCISSIVFYKQIRWCKSLYPRSHSKLPLHRGLILADTIIKMVWQPVNERFCESKSRIDDSIRQFELEARVEIDEITVQGIRGLQSYDPTAKKVPISFIFNVGFPRNNFFTGREQELSYLYSMMNDARRNKKRAMCAIHSMGGVGKTQLALEFAYRHQDEFDCVFWLPAEYGPNLAQIFASISKSATQDARDDSSDNLSSLIVASKKWLETTDTRWLLIYDNVNDWETIKPYWPSGYKGSILVTTQRAGLVQITGGSEIALVPLASTEGAKLLLRHLRIAPIESSADFQAAKSIADTVGGLPVAISHISGYLETSHSTLREFKALYNTNRQQSKRIWARDYRTWTNQYHLTLETTWDIALMELPPQARAFINVLAMLDAESVSEDILFSNTVTEKYPAILVRDFILDLGERQLVRRQWSGGKPFWSIHRALQRSLLHRLDTEPSKVHTTFCLALDIIRQSFPRQSDVQAPSNTNWLANEACLAHALHLEDVFKSTPTAINAPQEFVELLADVGNYMWERGLYERGIQTLQLAKKIHETAKNEPDYIEHSKVCSVLCGIYLEQGLSRRKDGLSEALAAWELRETYLKSSALPIKSMPKENCLLIGNAWNDIACCMLEYSCFDKVGGCLERSLQIKRDRGISENDELAYFNFAENYKTLAILMTAQGRHQEAISLSRRAVSLIEKYEHPESAVTQSFRFHLAYALYQSGKLKESFRMHERIRQVRIHVFGPQNVHTLNSYYACAVVLQALNQLETAEHMLLHCLETEVNQTWTSDYVARIKYRLAGLLKRKERHEDASRLVVEAQHIRENHARYFRPFEVLPGSESADMVVYDQMIPIEGGRSTIGQLRVSPLEMPEITNLLEA
ncbi:hypothetical protein BDW74DRAFT_96393 [Aspergillus multicolor]|uniref:uncharacterized protein n=1 Tax=Aspergillus multicolor TaxID=41759 RepID=UPI003CCCEA64